MSHSVEMLRACSLLFYIGSEITEAKNFMNLVLSDFPSLSRVYNGQNNQEHRLGIPGMIMLTEGTAS